MKGTSRQLQAITDHTRSMVVTAGAGTGKTHVLVNKYINILETYGAENPDFSQRISVQNILALTFTDKAAAEMKERIRSAIEKKEGPYWERSRLEFLLAPVQTFHSFCAHILREFAFEACVEPSFVVLDGRDASRILQSSYHQLIHTPAPRLDGDALVDVLASFGQHNLEKMIKYLYSRREEADSFFSRLESDEDGIVRRWQEEIDRFREDAVFTIRSHPDFIDTVQSLISFASMNVPPDDKAHIYLQEVRPFLETLLKTRDTKDFLHAARSYTGKKKLGRGGSAKNWGEQEIQDLRRYATSLHTLLKDADSLSRMYFDPEDPFSVITITSLRSLGETFHQFCRIVDKEKADAGGMDFTDLIRHTRRLFQTHRDTIISAYADRFRYILIDEFQDTDPAQFEIVTSIIGTPSPDVQSLFIVGDPKQSIYLFRQADVTRFQKARNLITGDCEGKDIILDISFRSSPAVISCVNHIFSRLFGTAEKPWEFLYDPISVSEERLDHTGSVTLLLVPPDDSISEYDAIADKIHEIISGKLEVYDEGPRDTDGKRTFTTRPAAFRDIAILLERRTHLGSYLHALSRQNIPYYVHKGTGFYNRQEILDLISMLSFLERPHDDIHLFGLLRSLYFGFSDLSLFRISTFSGHSFFEKLKDSCRVFPEHESAYLLLSGWLKRVGRYRLVPLIETVLDESGIYAVYGGLGEGDQILANIEKLVQIIRSREDSGRYHLSNLVSDLVWAVDREEEEGEAMIVDPELNAVRLMTVHASKGLEFPIVFVPEMHERPNLRHDPIIMDNQGDLVGLQLVDPAHDCQLTETPVYLLLKKEKNAQLLAEKKRLLYVAITRTADHLFMSGVSSGDQAKISPDSRLAFVLTSLGITREVIESGYLVIRPENSPQAVVQICIPSPGITSPPLTSPPFSIPEDMSDRPGAFIRKRITDPGVQAVPYLVTQLAGSLSGSHLSAEYQGSGHGASFGTAVHEVLRGRDPETMIRSYGIEAEPECHIIRTISDAFWSLPALSGVLAVLHELAFSVPIFGKMISGRMDLIVQLADGSWMVVDYKSDLATGEELTSHPCYRLQVEIYRRAAEIMGMKPIRGALFAVREKRLLELNAWEDTDLLDLMSTSFFQNAENNR